MLLRRVRAGDRERLQRFMRALSPRARLERFFAPVNELSEKQLERIVRGPGASLAALDEREAIVALAEYARVADGEAEFALVVADPWQGRGVGARLLAALLEDARRSGVTRLRGLTRSGNRAMRLLARKLGFDTRADDDPCFVQLHLSLGDRQ